MDTFWIHKHDGSVVEITGTYVVRGGTLIVKNADDEDGGPQVFSAAGWLYITHEDGVDFDYVARKVE